MTTENTQNEEEYATLELDLTEFDRNTLEQLIKASVDRDVSINVVINDLLQEFIDSVDLDNE